MAGESNPPYRISQTKMVMDTRFSGTDAAANAVGGNVVMVSAPRPFASEEKPRAGRVIEPASHGNGRNNRASTSYVYRTRGINDVFTGLVVRTYETR